MLVWGGPRALLIRSRWRWFTGPPTEAGSRAVAYVVLMSGIGVLALVAGVIALVAGSMAMLATLVASTGGLWVIATARHPPDHPGAGALPERQAKAA